MLLLLLPVHNQKHTKQQTHKGKKEKLNEIKKNRD